MIKKNFLSFFGNIYTHFDYYQVIRLVSMTFPLIALKIISSSNDQNITLLIKIIGLGGYMNHLLASDYHREYFIRRANKDNKNLNEKDIKKLRDLRTNYIFRTRIHMGISIPLITFLLGSNSIFSWIFTSIFIVSEKIFDELQRFLQCCRSSTVEYTFFIFFRKILLFLPIFICAFLGKGSYLIFLMISAPASIIFAWSINKGVSQTVDDLNSLKKIIFSREKQLLKKIFNINFVIQPLQALGISIIALVPYNILETLNNNNILADFAVCQKVVSLPLTLYINVIFVRFRNSIIKEFAQGRLLDKSSKYNQANLYVKPLILITAILSLSLFIFNLNFLSIFLVFLTTGYFTSEVLSMELFLWKFSSYERVKILLPGILLSFLIIFNNFLPTYVNIILFVLNCILNIILIRKGVNLEDSSSANRDLA